MYEKMRNDFLVALSKESKLEIATVLKVLDQVAMNYEVKQKDNDLIAYGGELPEAAKVYLACKKMAGLSDGTLENYKIILNVFFRELKNHLNLLPQMK